MLNLIYSMGMVEKQISKKENESENNRSYKCT